MQTIAPSHLHSHQSTIKILFGSPITLTQLPINMNFQLDIFSKKHENTWFNLQQLLQIQIGSNTLVIELQSKSTYGSELADKIQNFLKSNKNYNKKLNNKSLKINAIGKGNKVYVLINQKSITEKFEKVCGELEQNKEEQTYANNQSNAINFQIKSKNSFSQIRKLLDNQGAMRAVFDSLSFNMKFRKTKLVEQVILKFFEQIQQQNMSKLLKTFNKLNLQVKFESSQIFDFYQKLKVFAKIQNKIETYFFNAIKGQYKDNAKIYYFNKVFSLIGKVQGEGIESLIDRMFTEGSQQE